MEKHYRLTAIQHNPSTNYLSVSASIYLGERRVGALRTCPDTEVIEFNFALPMDRLVFENFITAWWSRADRTTYLGLTELAMKKEDLGYQPSITVKKRCWVKSIVRPVKDAVFTDLLAAA